MPQKKEVPERKEDAREGERAGERQRGGTRFGIIKNGGRCKNKRR